MKARVLNAWPSTGIDRDGAMVSVISFESTAPPDAIQVHGPFPAPNGDKVLTVTLSGLGLTMAEDDILVADGLVRSFSVRRGQGDAEVVVDIRCEFETGVETAVVKGMPYRIDLTLSRQPLRDLMRGIRIIIDPGHGGKDAGVRGPVNLLEKDCALSVARELSAILKSVRALPIMTREDDSYLAPGLRLAGISDPAPALAVEIHMSGERDPLARSYHAYAARGCEASRDLASSIASALTERMGTRFRGVEDLPDGEGAKAGFPLARIEPVCLTYFADEANFRAPLYRKRLAQGIFNGITRYLKATNTQGGGRL